MEQKAWLFSEKGEYSCGFVEKILLVCFSRVVVFLLIRHLIYNGSTANYSFDLRFSFEISLFSLEISFLILSHLASFKTIYDYYITIVS